MLAVSSLERYEADTLVNCDPSPIKSPPTNSEAEIKVFTLRELRWVSDPLTTSFFHDGICSLLR